MPENLQDEIANGRIASVGPKSLDEFLIQVQNAAGSDEQSTLSDPYGGALIPQVLLDDLLEVGSIDPTESRVTKIPMQTGEINVPARTDKDHSTSVAGGFTVYARTETEAAQTSRGEVEHVNLRARSADVFSFATEELLEDNPLAANVFIRSGLRLAIAGWRLDKKLNGTGVGEPEGILNSPCKVTVTRSTADDLAKADVDSMMSRCWNITESIFLCHPNGAGNLAGSFQYRGGRWVTTIEGASQVRSYSPPHYAGIPVFYTEFCNGDIGTEGDLILFQPSEYLWGTRSETLTESIHVRFVEGERAFRFTCRCDGRMWWRSALTPAGGGSTVSPVVVLSTNT